MPAVFDPSQPFSPVDEALSGSVPVNPASPVDAALASTTVKPPAPVAPVVPAFDPTQPFTPLPGGLPAASQPGKFDPSGTFTKQFTPDDVRAQGVDVLDKEKDFEPTDFGLQHEADLNADPALKEKVLEIYRRRSQDFRDLKDLASETGSHPLKSAGKLIKGGVETLGSVVKGVGQLVTNVNEAINPLVIVPRLLGHVAGEGVKAGINETLNEQARSAAEIPTSVEANITGLSNLGRKTVREVAEKAAAIDPTGFVRDMTGAKPKSELTPTEWRARFEDDVAGKKAAVDAVRGQGYIMQAIGLNADELKAAGIEIRPDVVAKLQPATDPLNFILLGEGAAVGAVGRVGGRFVVQPIAEAATREQALSFVNVLNSGSKVVGKGVEVAGQGIEKAGDLVNRFALQHRGTGTILGGVLAGTGNVAGGVKVLAGAKLTGPVLAYGGKAIQAVGRAASDIAALGADIGVEAAKGFGEGLLLTAPFTIGADPTEREGLLHAAALGGLARGGVRAGGLAGKAAAIAAQEQLAKHIFREIEQAPKPPEFEYGTDPTLDAMHSAQVAKVSPTQQKFLGWARNLFKDSFEIYVGDTPSFKQNVGTDSAFGSTIKVGQTLASDGTVKPLVRIFLNGDTEALPHELFHALADLEVPGAKDFASEVNKTLTPGERNYFEQVYNARLNPDKPPQFWTRRLSPEGLSSEIAAEVFSRVVLGQDLSGVSPTVMKKAAIFTSAILEKMGVPLGNLAEPGAKPGPGRSTLGIRPKAEAVQSGQKFVEGFLKQIEERGNLAPEPSPESLLKGGTLTPGEISRVKPSTTPPKAPTPVAPPTPTPTPSGGAPVTNPPLPKGPRNIRTTEAKQNDFAAKRAEVTNIEKAKDVAAKTGDANTVARVDEISKSMEEGNPVLEIEHSGVKNAGSAEASSGRSSRRTEQEEAYIAEGLGAAPKDVRDLHQKTFVPVRWEIVAGKPQLLAMSLDKVIANVYRAVKEAVSVKKEGLVPYDVRGGKLTDAAWNDVVSDLQSYAENQANGYRGDGGKLVRPTEDVGLSIPAENPSYNPAQLSGAKSDFLNMIQGLNPPLTAREVKGSTPGNVKGQILAEVNVRTPQKPSVIRPQDIKKQSFKSGREIMETNPLRNELAAAGAKVRELIEVTERINAEEINKVTPRPDINFKAPVTDTIRGGLLPGKNFPEGGSIRELGEKIFKFTPEEWTKFNTENGGLTNEAFRIGASLKDPADLAELRALEKEASARYQELKAAGDFDAIFPAVTKKQFFAEAIQAATGKANERVIKSVLGEGYKAPFSGEVAGPDASGALPGNKLAKPNAPVGSVGEGFQPPEAPRPDNTALAIPVEGVDTPVHYAGEKDGLTPMRFLPGKAPGEKTTPASPSYPDADRLARERGGNAWVRQSAEASNEERVLLVQFTPELMYPNGPDPVSTPYYDKLYSGVRSGYSRATDFWELPQWAAVATHNLGSKADFYAVRNMEEAKKFLSESDYGHVAFSVMDVSKAVTEELVPHINGQVDLGGYTDRTGAVAKNPKAKIWDSMNDFIESMGVKYEKGFDYRHFRGTEIIPRLELSAGCRHRCTFCTIDRKVTNSPLGEINAQVDSFSDLNAKLVYLNDKTFGQSPNVAEMPRLYKEMKAANPEFEGFVIQTTAAQMKTFTDKFLQDSGIKYVELGVESYNDPILKELRKPATEKLIDEAVEKLRRNKINFIPNIVIGFPGETAATYARTMAFLDKNSDVVSHLNTYNLAVYEGTEISKTVKAKTASDADENSFNKSFYADPKIHEDFAKSLYDYGTTQLGKETPFQEIQKGQLLPATGFAKDLDPIKEAAIRTKGGHVVTGVWHGEALDKLVQEIQSGDLKEKFTATVNPNEPESAYDKGELTDGFVTQSGRFLDRQQAFKHAEEIKQLDTDFIRRKRGQGDTLESTDFKNTRKFLPKVNNPQAVQSAAIRNAETGEIFPGATHGGAMRKASDAEGIPKGEFSLSVGYANPNYEQGFVTQGGEFLTRADALKRVEDLGQISPEDISQSTQNQNKENLEAVGFQHFRKFLPGSEDKLSPEDFKLKPKVPGAIAAAAVRLDDGKVITGAIHASAITAALEQDPYYRGGFEDGFVTNDGAFLDRKQALVRAEDIKQVPKGAGLAGALGYLETKEFEKNRKFLPAPRGGNRDDKGRPLKPDGTVDFQKFFAEDPKAWAKDQEQRAASVEPGELIEWPDDAKTPKVQLVQKTPLPDSVGGTLRLIHYSNNNDLKQIDPKFIGRAFATPTDLSGGNKSFFYVEGSGIGADRPFFSNSNKYGVVVDGNGIYDYAKDPQGFRKIINREEQDDGIRAAGYTGLRTQTRDGRDVVALYKTVKPVSLPKAKGQLLPGNPDTLPGLNLPSEEKAQQQRVRARVASSQDKFPEAIKLQYQKDDAGKYVLGEEGKPKPQTKEYNLMDSPLEAEAAKGLKGDARQTALETALGKKLVTEGKVALKNPVIEAGRKWYSTARTRLKGLFGEDTKFFTELLGATSARTPVEVNYRFALDAYNQFKQGKFDSIIKKYRDGKARWEQGKIQDFVKATGNENPTRGQFLDWWVETHDLGPTQSNGKKFGANSRQVLRVLDGSWREEAGGPKTPNFAGNLEGSTFEATIDVWAARTLHRLANEGNPKPWRILPPNETGVVDKDFEIGQAAYRYAAEKLNMKPDALQAVLWFAEKEYWEKKGWTRGAGAEKSDFNVLLKETEPSGGGTFKMKNPQQTLAFDVNPSDIVKKK